PDSSVPTKIMGGAFPQPSFPVRPFCCFFFPLAQPPVSYTKSLPLSSILSGIISRWEFGSPTNTAKDFAREIALGFPPVFMKLQYHCAHLVLAKKFNAAFSQIFRPSIIDSLVAGEVA